MRHHRNGPKLGRDSAHREALYMNLAASLIRHGRIKTTLPKAKATRPYVEKLVTKARTNDLHSRRVVTSKLRLHDRASSRAAGEADVVHKLFHDIAPRFADRPGGYTRIIKIGPRPGDAAPMAFLEWVDYVPEAPAGGAHAQSHTHADGTVHTHSHA